MKQQEFLARFRTNSSAVPPTFDRAELARWAAQFQSELPARRAALVTQFQQALELAGGNFHMACDPAEAIQIVCELVRARAQTRAEDLGGRSRASAAPEQVAAARG